MRVAACVGLLVCMLGDGDRVPAQTGGTPQAPTAAKGSSSGGLQGAAGWLDLSDKTRDPRSPLVVGVPSVRDAPWLPNGWSFRYEPPVTCTGCPDRPGLGLPNANALWQANGTLAWQTDAGMVGVRVTGQRGARLPLFMRAQGSATSVPMASDVTMSDTRTQWVVTLSAERAVLASRGRTISIFGDLYLPFGSTGRAPTIVDVRTPAQAALVGGARIRWK